MRWTYNFLLAISVLLLFSPEASAQAWPTLRGGPHHTGYVPISFDPSQLTERFSSDVRTSSSYEVVGGDGVCVLLNGSQWVGIDSGTGDILWVRDFSVPGTIAPAAFSDGKVYFRSRFPHFLWCLDAHSGEELFRVPMSTAGPSNLAPVVLDGRIYMGGGSGILCLDSTTGAEIWSADLLNSRDLSPLVTDDHVIAYTRRLTVFDRATGDLLFRIEDFGQHPFGAVAPTLLDSGNVVIINNQRLVCFDLQTQTIAYELTDQFTLQPAVANGVVYASNGPTLDARDETTGALLWSLPYPEGSLQYPPLVTNSHLFVQIFASTRAIDLTSHQEVWSTPTGGHLCYMDGALLISGGRTTGLEVEGDTDNDGLPQWWERRYGDLDPLADPDGDSLNNTQEFTALTDPANSDSDGDSLSDSEEVLSLATDPNSPDSDDDLLSDGDEVVLHATDPLIRDSDGDGLEDGQEIEAGLDPTDLSDATSDDDLDGFSNMLEVRAATDHEDPQSIPTVTDWAMLGGGPAHDSYQPLMLDATQFAVRWEAVIDFGSFGPVATGNGLVFTSRNDRLSAYDAGDGTLRWNAPVVRQSAPSTSAGRVYMHSQFATALTAHDMLTGAELFSADLPSSNRTEAPTIFDGQVFLRRNSLVSAHDATTGEQQWQINATPGTSSSNQWVPAVNEDGAYFSRVDGLFALDTATGTQTLQVAALLPRETPVLGQRNNILTAGSPTLSCFDLTSNTLLWSAFDLSSSFGRPAVGNGFVYSIQDDRFRVLNERSGALSWELSAFTPLFLGPHPDVVLTASHAFVANASTTYAINLTTRSVEWSYPFGGSLAIGKEGALYIAGNRRLVAIEVEGDSDGDGLPEWWERRYGGDLDPASDADADGLSALEEFEVGTDPTQADTDEDGLQDGVEVNVYGTDPRSADTDRDSLDDFAETQVHGTNPLSEDSDNDGLRDAVELSNGLNPLDRTDAEADFDSDSFSNRFELLVGTDFNDPTSFPIVRHWSMEGGGADHRSYQPLVLNVADFAMRWSKSISNQFRMTNVATGPDRVFVVSSSSDSLLCLDAINGELVWSASDDNPSANSPSYADGNVYIHDGAGGLSGRLLAYTADSGQQRFLSTGLSTNSARFAPTIYDGRVFAEQPQGSTSRLRAFDAELGSPLWSTTSFFDSNPWVPAVNGQGLFHVAEGDLIARDPTTGTALFSVPGDADSNSPVLGTLENAIVSGTELVCFDIANQGIMWQANPLLSPISFPTVGNGVVYALSDGDVIVLDEATGALVWTWDAPSTLSSNIIATATHLFVGGFEETYAVDLDTRQLVWSVPHNGRLALGAEGALYIYSGFTLYAYDVEGDADADGIVDWWERKYGGDLDATVDIDGDALSYLQEFEAGTLPDNSDTDGDGLNDGEELLINSTDPNSADTDGDTLDDFVEVTLLGTNPLQVDTDDDGLEDEIEVGASLDPLDSADVFLDPDGDGYSNRHEALAGSDVNAADSIPDIAPWSLTQRDTSNRGFQPLLLDPSDFQVRWEKLVGTFSTSAAVTTQDFVFTIESRELVCLSITDGSEIWRRPIAAEGSPSPPAVLGDLVYVVGEDEVGLRAYSASNGLLQLARFVGDYDSVTPFGEEVYLSSGSSLSANVALSGEQIWLASGAGLGEPAVDESSVYSIGNALTIRDRFSGEVTASIGTDIAFSRAALGSTNSVLGGGYCFDLGTNEIRWTSTQTTRTPTVANNRVFVTTGNTLRALHETSGAILWTFEPPVVEPLTSNVIATAAHVFVATPTTTYAVDRATHEAVWSYPRGRWLAMSDVGVLVISGTTTMTAIEIEGDLDNDGLPNWWERRFGGNIDPLSDDDSDGLSAAEEFEADTSPNAADSDSDGLDDFEEWSLYNSDPQASDSDGDGLGDAEEVLIHGTNPNVVDSDDDGIDDATELASGLDPTDPADASLDFDNDGFSNLQEALTGFDPHDASSSPQLEPWTMAQGGPGHRGYRPLALRPADFQVRWQKPLDAFVSGLATGEFGVWLSVGRDVVALDSATGETTWRHTLPGDFVSAPAYRDGRVFLQTQDSSIRLVALAASNGERLFTSPTYSSGTPLLSAPTVAAATVFVRPRTSEGVVALSAEDGSVTWEYDELETGLWEPATSAEFLFAHLDGTLVALETSSGNVAYSILTGESVFATPSPVFAENRVYFAEGQLSCFDASTAQELWVVDQINGTFGRPSIGARQVFATQGDFVRAFDKDTGALEWEWLVPEGILHEDMVATATHLFVAIEDRVVALNVNDGEVTWSFPDTGRLALGNEGALYIVGTSSLTAIDIETDADADGLPQWWERRYGNGNIDPNSDPDRDQLTAIEEFALGTNPTQADSDEDGLSDFQEVNVHSTDPLEADGDNDQLDDGEEVSAGTNPLNPDSDSDGLGDGAELALGLDPLNSGDADVDFDGDGYSNIQEYHAGSLMNDVSSTPIIEEWRMPGRSPLRDGYQPFLLDPAEFEVLWQSDLTEESYGLCLGGDKIFSVIGRELVAIDLSSGTPLWSTILGNFPSPQLGEPSYEDGSVYIASSSGRLRTLDANDGSLQQERVFSFLVPNAPTVTDGLVLLRDSKLLAVNSQLGFTIWAEPTDAPAGVLPSADENSVYHMSNGRLYVVDRVTGAVQYSIASPATAATAVLGRTGAALLGDSETLTSLSLQARRQRWQLTSAIDSFGTPVVGNGHVYVAEGAVLSCYDEVSGVLQWQWPADRGTLDSNILATASHVFVGNDGVTHAISVASGLSETQIPTSGALALGTTGVLVIRSSETLTAIQIAGVSQFLRGDVTGEGQLNLGDAIRTLNFLFLGAPPPPCLDAADWDDSGLVHLADAVGVVAYLFLSGPAPSAPFPNCGFDTTPDNLSCASNSCP